MLLFVAVVDKPSQILREILALICVVVGVFVLATHGDPSNF